MLYALKQENNLLMDLTNNYSLIQFIIKFKFGYLCLIELLI